MATRDSCQLNFALIATEGRGGGAARNAHAPACSALSNPSDRWRRRGSGRLSIPCRAHIRYVIARARNARCYGRRERLTYYGRHASCVEANGGSREGGSRPRRRESHPPRTSVHPRPSLSPANPKCVNRSDMHARSLVRRCS